MRIFPVYAPRMIAKHARIFRDGAVMVCNLGKLEFRHGRFITPKGCLPKVRAAVAELNAMLTPKPVTA